MSLYLENVTPNQPIAQRSVERLVLPDALAASLKDSRLLDAERMMLADHHYCFYEIDESMISVISLIHRLGYATQGCCSGHLLPGIEATFYLAMVLPNVDAHDCPWTPELLNQLFTIPREFVWERPYEGTMVPENGQIVQPIARLVYKPAVEQRLHKMPTYGSFMLANLKNIERLCSCIQDCWLPAGAVDMS